MFNFLPHTFTEEQRRAATELSQPVALFAGAGSGKTSVLVSRYLLLLSGGWKPSEILTLTFTNEAADEMRERIANRLTEEMPGAEKLVRAIETTPYIGTLHGFCYHLLDQYGSNLDIPGIRGILSAFEATTRFDEIYHRWLDGLAPDSLRELLSFFSARDLQEAARTIFQNHNLFRRTIAERPPTESWLSRLLGHFDGLVAEFEAAFTSRGIYSFDDLEYLARKLLFHFPAVADAVRTQFRAIMVDEFQDTSRLQWEILQLILGDSATKLFIVGDPKQSIYSFRNADVRLFQEVANQMQSRGGFQYELSANFRSDPKLLDHLNRLSAFLFRDSAIAFRAMDAGRESTEALPSPLKILRYGEGADKKDLSRLECERVAESVRELIREGADPAGIVLLFRVSDRIHLFQKALEEKGVPASGITTQRLFECYDVLDLTHYLRAVLNPLDSLSLAAFLKSPFGGLSPSDLVTLTAAPGTSLFEKMAAQPPESVRWFRQLVEDGELRLAPVLDRLFSHSSYFPRQTQAVLEWLGPQVESDWTVGQAVEKLLAWKAQDGTFQSRTGQEGVRLMTVHGAKGLEFSHVFIVDNLRQSPRRYPPIRLHPEFPIGVRYRGPSEALRTESYEQIENALSRNDAEESHRILYVALTRAEQGLYLSLPAEAEQAPRGSWGMLLQNALEKMAVTPEAPMSSRDSSTAAPRSFEDRKEGITPFSTGEPLGGCDSPARPE